MERDDAMLFEFLSEKKNIVEFLKSIFGFLARRTDFYHIKESPDDRLGFPAGITQKLLLDIYRKYDKNILDDTPVPDAINEVEITESENVIIEQEIQIPATPNLESNSTRNSFNSSEYYNGAEYENYCWSQTLNEIEIHILLPSSITTARQLKVLIESDCMIISNVSSPVNAILEGKFYARCRNKEAVWNICKNVLQINLDKFKLDWWPQFLLSEPKIDTSKIDCSQLISDMPQDQQNAIEKVSYDNIRTGGMNSNIQ